MSRKVRFGICACLAVAVTYGAAAPGAGAADLDDPVAAAGPAPVADVEPVAEVEPVDTDLVADAAPESPDSSEAAQTPPAPTDTGPPMAEVEGGVQPDTISAATEASPPATEAPSSAANLAPAIESSSDSIHGTLEGTNPELAVASAPLGPPVAGPRLALDAVPALPADPPMMGVKLGNSLPLHGKNSSSGDLPALPQSPSEPRPALETGLGPAVGSPQTSAGFSLPLGSLGLGAPSVPTAAMDASSAVPSTPSLDASRPGIAKGPAALLDVPKTAPATPTVLSSADTSGPIASANPASPPSQNSGQRPGSSAGSGSPTSGGTSFFFFFGFAAMLLGLLVLARRAVSRRIRSAPVCWRPVPFVSLLERPG